MTETVGKVFGRLALPVGMVVAVVVSFTLYRHLQHAGRGAVKAAAEPVPLPAMSPVISKVNLDIKPYPPFQPIGAPAPGHQGVPAQLYIPTAKK